MGRYPAWTRKATVEDCHVLSVSALRPLGIMRTDGAASGLLRRENYRSSFRYHRIGARLFLAYTINGKEEVEYRVNLVPLPLKWNNGTERLVFECPNLDCRRRAYKLYLAPGGRYFLCRKCNHLAYESQLHHPNTIEYVLITPLNRLTRIKDERLKIDAL